MQGQENRWHDHGATRRSEDARPCTQGCRRSRDREAASRKLRWTLLTANGDYRKVGNGTTTRALRFVSILKSHHSSNRSHQGHGKRRKASGRSCLSAFATACTTAERTSAGICATAASSRYAEASARCLSARSRRSGVRRTSLDGLATVRQTFTMWIRRASVLRANKSGSCSQT